MDARMQRLRLMICGAVSLYESRGLDIPPLLIENGRPDLADALDAVMTALYWAQAELEGEAE